jgi:predicted metal-binding protein
MCPPDSPTAQQTKALLTCYQRAILLHIEIPASPDWRKHFQTLISMLVDLEGDMFKDGYYKALVLIAGSCRFCKECTKGQNAPCNFPIRARPSLEACGVDVYQTARNNGFFVKPLKEKTETQNRYCLMLAD